ncbi:MAG: YqeG family HAD IIIA-type phosphatase [Lachnospiraceae bacterium]|nr:YqeG family HAD IIIA-type phosphatase [Lachnospiraceae bacterium]MBQ7600890.1 YqeG family HAD IIIA-type phosphatase [Lachnospiraceae bacterium]
MWKRFYPDERAKSVRDIDYEAFLRRGVRGIIFDIDNTLVPQDAPATEETEEFFRMIHALGFRTCVISNNTEERVKPFAERAGSEYVFHARKPLKRSYRKAMAFLGTDPQTTLFVGDQLLTDMFGARRLGIPCVLVEPISLKSDIATVRFKRKIEKWILKEYEAKK